MREVKSLSFVQKEKKNCGPPSCVCVLDESKKIKINFFVGLFIYLCFGEKDLFIYNKKMSQSRNDTCRSLVDLRTKISL